MRYFACCRATLPIIAWALVASVLGASPARATETFTLRLKSSVRVQTPVVYLEDIVETCPNPYICRLKVFSSPRWGKSRAFTREDVRRRLATLTPYRYLLDGSARLTVSSAGGDRAREVWQRITAGMNAATNETMGIRYVPIFPSTPVYLPDGPLEVQVTLPDKLYGIGMVKCRVLVNGVSARSINLSCRIIRDMLVPVALRDLAVGDTLHVLDYEWVKRSTSGRVRDMFEAEGAPERFGVKRPIKRGQIVYIDALRIHPLVERGDRVRLVIRRGAVTISAQAVALQDGWSGSRVRVRNLSTNRYVYGKVAAKGVVLYE